MSNVFRNVPSVGEILESPPLKSLLERVNRNVVVTRVKHFLDDMQSQVRTVAAGMHVPAPAELALRIADWISADRGPAVVPVINATGAILHPRLGRAPLADEALAELAALTHGYASFGLDVNTGAVTPAAAAVDRQLQRLTGADAVAVTASLAGAGLTALSALAEGREVVVARGQVMTIEGGFRVPDLFRLSGAILREAGTANVTRIDDYSSVISDRTTAILHICASGLSTAGNTASTPRDELVSLARRNGLIFINCLADGALVDLTRYGLTEVPEIVASMQAGADLTIFPGDGFLGGPPCGIIAGRRSLVEKINGHPLMAAVGADKLTLAALSGTLRLYEDQDVAERSIPVLSLLSTPLENLRQRAERLAPQIAATGVATPEVASDKSYLTGQQVPGQSLPTIVLSLRPIGRTAAQLADELRGGAPTVIGRMENDRFVLDLRSIMPRDDLAIVSAFESLSHSRELQANAPTLAPENA